MTKSAYVTLLDDDNYYCLLPNHIYKKIPSKDLVENIDWMLTYYKVYKAIQEEKITDKQEMDWSLAEILKVIDIFI